MSYSEKDCIFCKIIKGEIPCYKVYEDKDFIAFLDINPVNMGHTLVVPRKHFETVLDIEKWRFGEIMKLTKKLSQRIINATKADGFELCINNKKAAGQLVPHLHIHIMPRFKNDGLKFNWPTKKFSQAEMQKIANKIKNSL
ncbi:MAG: HIT family protein [Candidatus Pacearchaeota archaeon]|nr:HIT family protein [Candidatus Pacearchaeota archaeon]